MSCLLTACLHARWESMWSNTKFDFEEDVQHPEFCIRWVGFGVKAYSCVLVSFCPWFVAVSITTDRFNFTDKTI